MYQNFKHMYEKLNLTDDQKTKMHAIKSQSTSNMKENMEQLKSMHGQMMSLIHSNDMDKTKLDNLVDNMTKIKAGMMKNYAMMRNQMYNILDDKQKTQLDSLRTKAMADCQKR